MLEDDDQLGLAHFVEHMAFNGTRHFLEGDAAPGIEAEVKLYDQFLPGSASPKDLETFFELIHLTFTAPRADVSVFNIMIAQSKAALANRAASPDVAFMDTLMTTLAQNYFRARPMTVELIDEMNLDKSYAFYKDRFSDAGDFTFIFVGNLDLEVMKPLVERYLGALPSLQRKESWRDVGMNPPQGSSPLRGGAQGSESGGDSGGGPGLSQHEQLRRDRPLSRERERKGD